MTKEVASERARDWFARQEPGDLAISDWVVAEVSSALSIKLRVGAISAVERAEVLAAFGRLSDRSFMVLPVDRAQFRDAARLADLSDLGLRAADALHVAIALDHGATLCTLDQRLADAAIAVALQVDTI